RCPAGRTGSKLMTTISRRGFFRLAGAGAAAGAIGVPQARAQQKAVTVLHESSFIKPFDEYMQKKLAPAYEKQTGVKIDYQLISVGSIPTRVSAIAETGSGADITMNISLMPFLFAEKYVDVGDITEEMGKEQGGWYPAAKEMGIVNGKWKAVPFCSI